MLLTGLRDSYEDTLVAAEGADLIVGNLATCATGLVAEKRGLPWASVMHIPIVFFSAYDPPLLPGLPAVSNQLTHDGHGRLANRYVKKTASRLRAMLSKSYYERRGE
jgi:hypothetical protein